MATFSHLASELLLHILKLANEGKHAQRQQRFRLAFGLISRACYLATANAGDFYVAGEKQAIALSLQLARERKAAAAQEERLVRSGGRTSRSARTSRNRVRNIRRLFLNVNNYHDQASFVGLLQETPSLVALEINVSGITTSGILPPLEVAIGGLVGLREFHISAYLLEHSVLQSCLIPLQALEVLGIDSQTYFGDQYRPIEHILLPQLRKVHINLGHRGDNFPKTLLESLAAAANSTSGLRELQIESSELYFVTPKIINPLLPHLTHLTHFTWVTSPDNDLPLEYEAQGAVLALIGALKGLKYLSMPMWTLKAAVTYTKTPIDRTLFDALATLPTLHNVNLIIERGILSKRHAIAYMNSHESLQSLSIHFSRARDAWTQEQREVVQKAADRAEVTLSLSQAKR